MIRELYRQVQRGEIDGIPAYVGELFRERQLKPTERERVRLLAQGIFVPLDSFTSARLMRAMALEIDPDKLAQGGGANRADDKPHLQHRRKVGPALADGREQIMHGRQFLFCADFELAVGCRWPNCSFMHACNCCRCGPWRQGTTGCVNVFLSCCLQRGASAPRARGMTTDTVQYVGVEATEDFPCPGGFWGPIHPNREGTLRTAYDQAQYLVDINDWGPPPPERLRRAAKRWRGRR